jgi:hypothetical protein
VLGGGRCICKMFTTLAVTSAAQVGVLMLLHSTILATHIALSLNNMNEIDYIERLLLLSIHFACFPAALYINTKCAQSSAARFISALVKRWSSFTPRPHALYVSAKAEL